MTTISTTSIGDNIARQALHHSKAYPKLSPQEMKAFILFVQARPFRPAGLTYRDWYEQEKKEAEKSNTLLSYLEEY